MWRPMEGYGSPLGDCGCGCNGFGLAGPPMQRYPAIEQALRDYIAGKAATGQYFYINPALNTARLRQTTFGEVTFLQPDPAADPVAAVASDIGSFFGSLWGNTAPADSGVTMDPNGITGTWSPSVSGPASTAAPIVNSLPSDLTPSIAQAAKSDLFGNPLSPWIIGGAAALFLLAGAMAAMPHKTGRRRR